MRIVHVNTYSNVGGAAIAVNRINKALDSIKGIDSYMVNFFNNNEDCMFNKLKYRIFRKINKFPLIFYNNNHHKPFSTNISGVDISKNNLINNADLINLHWINHGYLNYKALEKLFNLSIPIVWTMHDMWAMTGGCHYSFDCDKFKNQCCYCPVLNSKKEHDLSYKLFNKKKEIYRRSDFNIIAVSNWLSNRIKDSALLKNKKIKVIPNCLNISIFKSESKLKAQKYFNINSNKKYIIFGAFEPDKYFYKGYYLFIKLIRQLIKNKLHTKYNLGLLIFGTKYDEKINNLGIYKHFLGHLTTEEAMKHCFNAGDIYITPSYQEAFGQTVIEAMACETPVIAFRNTGPGKIIDHKNNGFLAKYKSYNDLKNGLIWILENNKNGKIGKSARKKVESKYSMKIVGERYFKFYNGLIKENKND